MLEHDAHRDLEVLSGHGFEDPNLPGFDFPLPVKGNKSPTVLAFGMLAKITFVYGFFILLVRLVGLSYPDVALVLSYVVAGAFAISFGIKWLAPERGMIEWPIWVGAGIVLIFAADRFIPDSIFAVRLPEKADSETLIPLFLSGGLLLVILVACLSPSVKTLLTTKTRGPLALGAISCLVGGVWTAIAYVPESDFASWNFLAMMLVNVHCTTMLITDQYVRFEQATNPQFEQRGAVFPGERVVPANFSLVGFIALPASLWCGNLVFLANLHTRNANEFGFLTFLVVLAGFVFLGNMFRSRSYSPKPVSSAWNALTFWLTYNLQRNANPNVFQCLPWFREPLVRFAILGLGIMSLSLSLLHLSGVHGTVGRNKVAPDRMFTFAWKYATPQGYPKVVEEFKLNDDAKAIYDRWSETLVKNGDAPLPPTNPVRTLGDLLLSAAVFFIGGPLLFFFILATTQGNFISRQLDRIESSTNES